MLDFYYKYKFFRNSGTNKKILSFFTIIITIISISPSVAVNTELTIKSDSRFGFFPKYSIDTRDYAVRDCANKVIRLTFNRSVIIDGVIKKELVTNLKEDQVIPFTITDGKKTKIHTLRCLHTGMPKLDVTSYKYTPNGMILMELSPKDQQFGYIVIADKNGVPLWYRVTPKGSNPTMARFNEDGHLDVMLSNAKEDSGRFTESNTKNRIYRFDPSGKYVGSVQPLDREGNVLPIDYHGFVSDRNSFTFLSSESVTTDGVSGSIENGLLSKTDPIELAKAKACVKSEILTEYTTKIIKTDKKGKIIFEISLKDIIGEEYNGLVMWLGRENGRTVCYYDAYHPNWISYTPDKSKIIVSLRTTQSIFAIDIDSKKISWSLGTPKNGIGELEIINDPLLKPRGMHSGSINSNNELLVFDNRNLDNETGRAVIYRINNNAGSATFIREFLPPKDRCTVITGKVYCPTFVKGNATFTAKGDVIVNWGDKKGNPNIATLFSRDGKVLLDIRDESRKITPYKFDFIDRAFGFTGVLPIRNVLLDSDPLVIKKISEMKF